MVFSGEIFLYLFFPIVFILYYISPVNFRNYILLLASLCFYAWGEPIYILLMILSIIVNFFVAKNTQKYDSKKKLILTLGISFNILMLIIFKYANFIFENIAKISTIQTGSFNIALPVGISFFTFQAMSFIVDIYKNQNKHRIKLINTALYISFFPQLIAGPIVKYHDIESQIRSRKTNKDKIEAGLIRFIIGISKKILIANTMGIAADKVFSLSAVDLNSPVAWIGALSYTLQIYFDFSGYSDMAIGLAKIFGFELKENFNYPYISKSMREFWRRWHISLSTWFKEYVYIPLGGNRRGTIRTFLNLWIVFILTGFWHGAEWTFVLWGALHGFFMIIERSNVLPKFFQKFSFLNHIYVMFIVIVSFAIFNSPNISYAFSYIEAMFSNFNFSLNSLNAIAEIANPYYITILLLAIIGSIPIKEYIIIFENKKYFYIFKYTYTVILLLFSLFSLAYHSYNPFIYFRF